MSIDANTYEELNINNVNEKTADLATKVSKYLLETWGIICLGLTVDGVSYNSTEERIEEDSELYSVCQKLADAKEIFLSLRSNNGGGACWRIESSFMGALTDDEELKNNVTYKSTDYYDTESYVDVYLYDKNGLVRPEYDKIADDVKDIKKWYSYTAAINITAEDETDNEELYNEITEILTNLCTKYFGIDEDETEDKIDDMWEDYGEINFFGGITFLNRDIPAIKDEFNRLVELVRTSDNAEINIEIGAVPDGENDYNFASVAFSVENDKIKTEYCRF